MGSNHSNYLSVILKSILRPILKWVNLRPEEGDRTLLMFLFYTTISVGMRWLEDSIVALFLDKYGANTLPWIYIASAISGIILVFIYSWVQRIFPLRWVIVAATPCMVAPLILITLLQVSYLTLFTVFLLRLWIDALYVVTQLNTSIAANQLFNIREIKRTYPLVSSGILVADVLSGFSLPWLLQFVTLNKVILIGAVVIILGTGILLYLTHHYQQAFFNLPQTPEIAQGRRIDRLSRPLKRYAWELFAFGLLVQAIGLLVDFQYFTKLESNFGGKDIASFLAIFGGILGLFELVTQWFISSRAIERLGIFFAAAILPISIGGLLTLLAVFSSLSMTSALFDTGTLTQSLFWGLTFVKFIDELLRYTFVANSWTLLFQPIPDKIRSHVQTLSGGIAEAGGAGLTGIVILITQWLYRGQISVEVYSLVLILETALVALICIGGVWIVRSHYVDLLVLSAERGHLNTVNIDLQAFRRTLTKKLLEKTSEADKRSCIELLSQIDPQGATEILAPLILQLTPALQQQSLSLMLATDIDPQYLPQVRALLQKPQTETTPEIFASAMRYVWLTEANPDLNQLEQYLNPHQHPVIRGTAAALLLRQGKLEQKVTASKTLRWMLTHVQEKERINGVKSLTHAVYLQALRVLIPSLLNDKSLKVRCAVLEMIAANHLEEYYPALVMGLSYKSTRNTTIVVLTKLGNEVLPELINLAHNIEQPDIVKMYAWRTIGEIPTFEAINTLWKNLEISQGTTRCHILRTLLKRHQQEGIISLVDKDNELRVKKLIAEELQLLGEIYAAYQDFKTQGEMYADYMEYKTGELMGNFHSKRKILAICKLIQKALLELEIDVQERLLLLLKLLYPIDKINAATYNLKSKSRVNLARGLEILEHTVNLPEKAVLLNIFDRRSPSEKLNTLVEATITQYQQLTINQRTRQLLDNSNSLSDWCWACCFHFAGVARIRLTTLQIEAGLRHICSFVREAAISYLKLASPSTFKQLLPQLKNDPHPLVINLVNNLLLEEVVKS